MTFRLLNEPAHQVYEQLEDVLEAERLWADEESLADYRSNIAWRALGDPSYLPYPPRPNTYFPPDALSILPDEVIVDCGAFDGDTIRLTLNLVGPAFKAIYAIEADEASNRKMDTYLAALPCETRKMVHRLDCAVGETHCKIQFAVDGNLTSKMGESGREVDCIPLDELFADTPITFLKMDIEGAEHGALLGASKIIRRDQPVLAICTYHTQNDVWRIPLLIRSMNPDYRLYLRTYVGDGFQSVCYAVPPRRVLAHS